MIQRGWRGMMTFWRWWFQAWQIWTGCESSPTLTSFFISSMKSKRGRDWGWLERAESWLALVKSGCSFFLPLGGTPTWGAKIAARTPPLGSADLSVQSLSQAQVVLLPRAVLSVVLVCLSCCPWREELVCGALSRICLRLTALLLAC